MRKDDEQQKTFFRTEDRIFQVNGQWWFATREGDRGPFASRQAAADELVAYILEKRGDIELTDHGAKPRSRDDVWDGHLD